MTAAKNIIDTLFFLYTESLSYYFRQKKYRQWRKKKLKLINNKKTDKQEDVLQTEEKISSSHLQIAKMISYVTRVSLKTAIKHTKEIMEPGEIVKCVTRLYGKKVTFEEYNHQSPEVGLVLCDKDGKKYMFPINKWSLYDPGTNKEIPYRDYVGIIKIELIMIIEK